MFTWGDHSFGQTGNNYKDDCEPFCEDKPRDQLDPNYDPTNDHVPLHPLFKGRTWNKGLTLRSGPKAEDPEIGKQKTSDDLQTALDKAPTPLLVKDPSL